MKRTIIFILGLVGISLLTWAGVFYWRNLRGIGPAIRTPAVSIVQRIKEATTNTATNTGSGSTNLPAVNETEFPLDLPEGFTLSVFAEGLENARVLALDPAGTLLVSLPSEGKVVALPNDSVDSTADRVLTVAEDLEKPHGLLTRCRNGTESCQLFVAATDQLVVYDYDPATRTASNQQKLVDLPTGGQHTTRTLLFRPGHDDEILISIGSSCNACNEKNEQRATIYVINTDGSNFRPYATGLRNSVFMTTNPITGQVWATEMGRDYLGDDLPPDEINIVEAGKNYGWPICYGDNVHDTVFDTAEYIQAPCQDSLTVASHIDLPAHSAPLGLAFIPEEGWPEEFRHDLLVAFHGSWNRSDPTGYKIVRFELDENGNVTGQSDFISGWLTDDDESLGRPVDMLLQPGGTGYISDDKAGVIYRLARRAE